MGCMNNLANFNQRRAISDALDTRQTCGARLRSPKQDQGRQIEWLGGAVQQIAEPKADRIMRVEEKVGKRSANTVLSLVLQWRHLRQLAKCEAEVALVAKAYLLTDLRHWLIGGRQQRLRLGNAKMVEITDE